MSCDYEDVPTASFQKSTVTHRFLSKNHNIVTIAVGFDLYFSKICLDLQGCSRSVSDLKTIRVIFQRK